jgi:hypothetical protein
MCCGRRGRRAEAIVLLIFNGLQLCTADHIKLLASFATDIEAQLLAGLAGRWMTDVALLYV